MTKGEVRGVPSRITEYHQVRSFQEEARQSESEGKINAFSQNG